jgi:hypothetical protein
MPLTRTRYEMPDYIHKSLTALILIRKVHTLSTLNCVSYTSPKYDDENLEFEFNG